ncbi:hypothetical protein GCM10010464_80080 [Pseudonocardia yunnanensis]|uniref:DUF222 domain-containing protein n=1 Tax=Pseudonocardia yunnanensis TaxID=58107 RepID=A0ABW4EMZ3_9PSEU
MNRDATVQALVASQDGPGVLAAEVAVRRRLAEAETVLELFQNVIAAGVEPGSVVEGINQARAVWDAARPISGRAQACRDVDGTAEVHAPGDVHAALDLAKSQRLARLYKELDVTVRFRPTDEGGRATLRMSVADECVRGGTCALTTRLALT